MKQFLCLILAAVLALNLSACGGDAPAPASTAPGMEETLPPWSKPTIGPPETVPAGPRETDPAETEPEETEPEETEPVETEPDEILLAPAPAEPLEMSPNTTPREYGDRTLFHQGLLAVQVGEHWGAVNLAGELVVPAEFQIDALQGMAFDQEGMALAAEVSEDGMWYFGYIDTTGDYVIEPQFFEAAPFRDQDVAVVHVYGGGFGLIDRRGALVLPAEYEHISLGVGEDQGIVGIRNNGKNGYVSCTNLQVIEPQFDRTGHFSEQGLALVGIDGRIGFIDLSGQWAIAPRYVEGEGFGSQGLAPVAVAEGVWSYINTAGETVIPGPFQMAGQFTREGYAEACVDGRWGVIDTRGSWVLAPEYEGIRGLDGTGPVAVRVDGKWGYLRLDGTWVAEPRFGEVEPFDQGVAVVVEDGEYALIDAQGELLVEFGAYDHLDHTRGGSSIWASRGDNCGLLDLEGQEIVPMACDQISILLADGYAAVCMDGKWGVVDRRGEYLIQPAYDNMVYSYG